jgi:type IV fimbrial biogenesis protein FimT
MNTAPFSRKPIPAGRSQRGVTLVESMAVMAVLAVTSTLAVPGLGAFKGRQALNGAAAEFETDVQHVRSLAVAVNAPLRISFDARDGASCYIVHSGASGDCECSPAGEALCRNGAQAQRMVRFPSAGSVALSANVRSIVFDPVRGTSTPTATVRFANQDNAAVHQVVNILGRVRSCSPGQSVPGYKAC